MARRILKTWAAGYPAPRRAWNKGKTKKPPKVEKEYTMANICGRCYDLPHRRPRGKECKCGERFGTLPPPEIPEHDYSRVL